MHSKFKRKRCKFSQVGQYFQWGDMPLLKVILYIITAQSLSGSIFGVQPFITQKYLLKVLHNRLHMSMSFEQLNQRVHQELEVKSPVF